MKMAYAVLPLKGLKIKHRLSPFESELYDTIHGIRQFGPKMGLAPVVSN